MTAYLELSDYLLLAERVLGLPAEAIANFHRIGLAESALAAPRAGFFLHRRLDAAVSTNTMSSSVNDS